MTTVLYNHTTHNNIIISYSRRCGTSVVDAAMRLTMTSKEGFSRPLDDGASSIMSLIIIPLSDGRDWRVMLSVLSNMTLFDNLTHI